MKNKSNILCVVLMGVIVLLLFYRKEGKTTIVERHTIDTAYITRIDTQYIPKPIVVEEVVFDTIYVGNDSLYLPLHKRTFTDNSTYKAIVSGYNPSLDYIEVYQKENTKIITNTNVKEVVRYKSNLYLNGGFDFIRNEYAPKIGLVYTTPKKWMISAEAGVFDGKPFYGASFGLKIR